MVLKGKQGSLITNVQHFLLEEFVKYLGHQKELSKTWTLEQNTLKELIHNETAFAVTCYLSPHLVFTCYTHIYFQKTTYHLFVFFFSKN